MTDNIIKPTQFGGKLASELVDAQYAQIKSLLVEDACAFEDLDLKEPRYGDTVIGTLTDQEAELFVSLYLLSDKLAGMNRHGSSEFLIKLGEAVRDENKNFNKDEALGQEFAIEYFRLEHKVNYLRSMFNFMLAERMNCFDHFVGVRSRRRIVKSNRKW